MTADSDLQAKEGSPGQGNGRPVERLIAAFGGAQALARRLDLPAATVEEWRSRGAIPRERAAAIAQAAEREGIALEAELLAQSLRAAPTIEAEPAVPATLQTPQPAGRKAATRGRILALLPAMVLGGLLVAAGFLLAMGTSGSWLGTPPDWSGRVAALEEKVPLVGEMRAELTALSQQVAALQRQVEALPHGIDGAALDGLGKDILAEVDRKLAALPAADPAPLAALESALAEANRRLEDLAQQQVALEQALAALPPPAPAPAPPPPVTVDDAAAIAALAARVAAGEPYASELALLQPLAAAHGELAEPLGALAFNAQEGVATEAELLEFLRALAPAILLAGHGEDAGEQDTLDGLTADLSLLLGGRRVGEVEGESAEARVARAELRLQEGRLAAAVDELKPLSGAAAEAAAPWLAKAEARLATLAAIDRIQQLAASWLAGN